MELIETTHVTVQPTPQIIVVQPPSKGSTVAQGLLLAFVAVFLLCELTQMLGVTGKWLTGTL